MKNIGIIGSGKIGLAVANHLVKSGYSVSISNSRSPVTLSDTILQLGSNATAATTAEAAQADIVVLALPWIEVKSLTGIIDWNNKIVIDATNQFINSDLQLADLAGRSSSEVVLDHLPGARLVKAFNTLSWKTLAADPKIGYGNRVLFISGDDNEAAVQVSEVISDMGFAPINLGSLAVGSKLLEPKASLSSLNLIQL